MVKNLDIKLGFTCNNNCRHCVIAAKRHLGDKNTEEIKRELEAGRQNGCEQITITGGEPTIRPDIFEIVSYSKDLGYRLIQLQTNGRMFFSEEFARKLMDAGIDEFVVAIHGHEPSVHDFITRAPGSFIQTVQGIKNLKKHNAYIYTNTVITKLNYKILPELTKLLIDLKVDHIQFAFVHPMGNAHLYYEEIVPNVSECINYIHKALDICRENNTTTTVEAIPFCWMQGYEEHVVELYMPNCELRDMDRTDYNFEVTRREKGKFKSKSCAKCKYDAVCEGFWREYAEKKGLSEFKTISGKSITNPKVLFEKSEFAPFKQIIKPMTFHLQWHITERCNLRCKHCYQEDEYMKNELSLDKLFMIVDQYVAALKAWDITNPLFAPLSLTGGEPLIRKDFFKLLEKCYENRNYFVYNIMSNGLLITKKTAKKFKDLNVQGVQISLEGMKEKNDLIRGKGTFDKICKAIRVLVGEGVKTSVSFTAHKYNLRDVPQIINLCRELNVNGLGIRRLVPCGRGSLIKNMMLQPLELKKLYEFIDKTNKKSLMEKIELNIGTGCENSLWTTENPNFSTHGCSAAYDSFSILPNGDVVPCRRLPIKVGNVNEKTLFEIYNSSDILKEIRDKNNLSPSCKNCFHFNLCAGGARCIAYGYWNDATAPDPQCWKLFDKLPAKSALEKSEDKGMEKEILVEKYLQH
jgi:radical SAM protein with 4Fe4S-binding SPASM domain